MKKIDSKEQRVTIRLTQHQAQELESITKELNVSKAGFMRYILEQSINKYYARFDNQEVGNY